MTDLEAVWLINVGLIVVGFSLACLRGYLFGRHGYE